MKLNAYPLEKLRHEVRTIIGLQLDLTEYAVVFFGSRVSGTADERSSDIDIGIMGPKEVPLALMLSLREQLNALPTPYTFDLVDLSQTREAFRTSALKNAVPV